MTRCGLEAMSLVGSTKRRVGCGRRHGYATRYATGAPLTVDGSSWAPSRATRRRLRYEADGVRFCRGRSV
jgi:hypothetical protein